MADFVDINGIRCYAPDVARGYQDYPSEGFDVTADVESRSFWCRTRNRVLRRVFRRFVNRPGPVDVLEIGCGIGGVIRELRTIPGLRLTGSEIYLNGLLYARKALPDVTFIQLDATRIPFERAFDVVGAFDVLEHVEDDRAVIMQVKKALRPGGLFVVTVPQHKWMWSQLDEIVEHKRRYQRAEMIGRLREAGFTVLYATSFVTTLFPLMAVRRWLSRHRPRTGDTGAAFRSEVVLPGPLNRLFDAVMRIDETLLRCGLTLPFGGSLLVVATAP